MIKESNVYQRSSEIAFIRNLGAFANVKVTKASRRELLQRYKEALNKRVRGFGRYDSLTWADRVALEAVVDECLATC